MAGQHYATILARTDPFDVAQGLERYVRTLSGEQVRAIISDARPHLNRGYRAEFVPLLDEPDDGRLKRAFIGGLKSNLRAIPLFGAAFCEGLIAQIPGDRAVGLGEETRTWPALRPAAVAIAALVLVLGGATIHHLVSAESAAAHAPVVLEKPRTPAPFAVVAHPVHKAAVPIRRAAVRVAQALPAATPPAAAAVTAAPVPAVPSHPKSSVTVARRLPPGSGVKTVVAQRTPPPQLKPGDVDTSDMPQAYTDATPLPSEAPPPARVSTPLGVPTPTPGPNRSWTHRLLHAAVRLVNSTLSTVGVSKKPTPTPSPSGPRP